MRNMTSLLIRIGLFILILALGTVTMFIVGESTGLAVADLSSASIKAITKSAHNDVFYAALGARNQPNGIFRSLDKGRSWQWINAGPEAPISALAVDPVRPDILYVGTEGQGLYRLNITDKSTEPVNSALPDDLYVNDVVIGPEGRIYLLTTEGLLVNRGDAWSHLETLPDLAVSLVVNPADAQTLYAGTVGYGVFRSQDGGRTWQAINEGLNWKPGIILRIPALASDEDNISRLALATAYGIGDHLAGGGIYESLNAGESWTQVAESREIVDQLMIEEGEIYAATLSGLNRYAESRPSSLFAPWAPINPIGPQGAILLLTIALGGWVLLGQGNWPPYKQPKQTPHNHSHR